MGFVEVHLSDEDKFKVVLLAFGVFLLALLCSLCLAVAFCPLNKWLLERNARKRRQQLYYNQQRQFIAQCSTPVYLLTGGSAAKLGLARAPSLGRYGSARSGGSSCLRSARKQLCQAASYTSYSGPPPAYEAALRATRLQSLTGAPPQLPGAVAAECGSPLESQSSDKTAMWPPQLVAGGPMERELDLGDYFHQPKEFTSLELAPHLVGEPCLQQQQQQQQMMMVMTSPVGERQAPVMLRFWVRVMEPGELVRRARGSRADEQADSRSTRGAHSDTSSSRSLSRQLSIPQLFGSLVTLASGQRHGAASDGRELESQQAEAAEREMHSIISTSTNTSSSSSSAAAVATHPGDDGSRADQREGFQDSAQTNLAQINAAAANQSAAGSEENSKQASEKARTSKRQPRAPRRRSSSFLAINSVTSRVLHMNVASFSYVRDEQLINTKKHNQLNYHHFFASPTKQQQQQQQSLNQEAAAKSSKLCQLFISVCDIENMLNSCWLNEKSCALLAYSSAIYVQCDILLPAKSKSVRLLSYPLRALNQSGGSAAASGPGGDSARTHTVNFSTAISAAALESNQPAAGFHRLVAPPPTMTAPAQQQQRQQGESQLGSMCGSSGEPSCVSSTDIDQTASSSASLTNDGPTAADPPPIAATPTRTSKTPARKRSTNWRHDPQADGKPIVTFTSVPKQIAQEQDLAAASSLQQQQQLETDLIQFDSVFVSPILSKSTVEEGCLRFRVYSQCKYVNETCLAELKLPLKQLLRSETRDNLGDVNLSPSEERQATNGQQQASNQQKQADFILDKLLENLVTANTGSPLSTLIERISIEEREAEELEQQQQQQSAVVEQSAAGATGVFGRLPWLLSAATHQHQSADELQQQRELKRLKLSNSLNESLCRLGSQAAFAKSSSDGGASDSQLHLAAAGTNFKQDLDLEQNENEDEEEDEVGARRLAEEQHERLMEQNYCRSLMVSHWLNYLVAPSYECQLSDEAKGKVILGLTYLPTSNRLIFNAHKASIESEAQAAAPMKNLRLQSSTCYLLRFLMVLNGRVAKRKQTGVGRRPEWDSQEPITFDLASVSVAQPHFIVALVMRSAHLHGSNSTGSLQNLHHQCRCPTSTSTSHSTSTMTRGRRAAGALSEPETGCTSAQQHQLQQLHGKRDLVIGHVVIGEEMWRELRLKPRKQIVRQFKIY